MARIRVFIRMSGDDAFELKAQALNDDPRLKAAGISALKFESDKKYIAEGEFPPGLPHQTVPEPGSVDRESASAIGEKLRVVIRLLNEDANELKAQALNNDPGLKEAGISALKFESDKKYIADGEFSPDLPPQETASPAESESQPGERLRVVIRLLNEDAYELKAQALNNDPGLKEAGISALKFVDDKQYLLDGEFSSDSLAQEAASSSVQGKPKSGESLRVYLRVLRADAYNLVSNYMNGDPRLREAGIAEVSLVKGGGVAAAPDQLSKQPLTEPAPAPVPKRKRSPLRGCFVWGLILLILFAAGAVFAAPNLIVPLFIPASPTATVIPTDASTPTQAPVPVTGPTSTSVPITKTRTAVPTLTRTFTPEPVLSCPVPEQGTILQQLNCRWGPGSVYIYADGAFPGESVQIIGRADTAFGTWIYVQLPRENPVQCWINSDPKFSDYQGEVACLEPYYPDKARWVPFSHPNFPPPNDVSADRQGDQVNIYWTAYPLAAGDRPDEGLPPYAPIYLVETWTCQGGKIVFTPQGFYLDIAVTDPVLAAIQVTDEGGCSEPSHGRVFLAHKDGYVGPVDILWPQ